MSTERKLLLALGASLLVLMSSIAAFSLGVYVSANGWKESPSIAGPGSDRSPAQPARPEGLPAGKPALTGSLIASNRTMLTLRTRDGARQVLVGEGTRVLRWDGQALRLTDLSRGMPLAVFGEFDDDDRVLRASHLILLPPPDADAPAQ